jgi:hypothetical protein
MLVGRVYMITSPNDRIYIGSTSEKYIENRWKRYKNLTCKNQIKLFNSLKKYGSKSHTFEEIWSGDINDMLRYECIVGNWYEVLDKDKGLNLKLPKIDDVYQCTSEETRLKQSLSQKGIARGPMSEERKNKMKWKRKPLGYKREGSSRKGVIHKKHKTRKLVINTISKGKPWTQARRDAQNNKIKKTINEN